MVTVKFALIHILREYCKLKLTLTAHHEEFNLSVLECMHTKMNILVMVFMFLFKRECEHQV